MPRFVTRIPFYQSRKPIDFFGGFDLFKQNLFTDITNQAYTTLSPVLTQESRASANEVIQNFLISIKPIAPTKPNFNSVGISAGAGYSGGTSAAAKSILSSYASYKATGKTSTPTKKK